MCDSALFTPKTFKGPAPCSSDRDPCFYPYSDTICSKTKPGYVEYFGYMRTDKHSLNTKTKCLEASGKPPGETSYRKPDCCVPNGSGWAGRFITKADPNFCTVVNDYKWINLQTWNYKPPHYNTAYAFAIDGPIQQEGKVRYVAQLDTFHGTEKEADDIVNGKTKIPVMTIYEQTFTKPSGWFIAVGKGYLFEFFYDDGGKRAKPTLFNGNVIGLCGSKEVQQFLSTLVNGCLTPCTANNSLACAQGRSWVFGVVTQGLLTPDYWQRHWPDWPAGLLDPDQPISVTWAPDCPWLGILSQKPTDDYWVKKLKFANQDSGKILTKLTYQEFAFCGETPCTTPSGTTGIYKTELVGQTWAFNDDCTFADVRDGLLNRLRPKLSIIDPNGATVNPAYFDAYEKKDGTHIYAYFTGICPTDSSCAVKDPHKCDAWRGKCCTQENGCPAECHWDPKNPACNKAHPFNWTNIVWIGVFAAIGFFSYRVYMSRTATKKT